jgi:hypothetical protein
MYNMKKKCHIPTQKDVSFYVVGFVTLVNVVNSFVRLLQGMSIFSYIAFQNDFYHSV